MPGSHSRLSPSSAHRWRKCPDAPNQEEGLPDDSGIEAAEGTVFHEYAALCLEIGLDPQVFVGAPCDTDHGVLTFTQEMADAMLYGLDYVRDFATDSEAGMYIERQVDLSPWLGEGEFGTSDCCLVSVAKRRIIIFDWKYGMGVPVSPIWNDQGILYGLGCWNTFGLAEVFAGIDPADIEVLIVIEQPRARGGGGVWYTNMAVLLAEGHKIIIDAEATKDPEAVAVPGVKQCQFCRAAKANTCKARAEHKLRMFDLGLEDIDGLAEDGANIPLPKPKALTPAQRSYILLNRTSITNWLETLHAEAYDDALKGRSVPEMKLVLGRNPARKWKDEEKTKPTLERVFGDKAYTRKLLSPTQVEEAVGKRAYAERFAKHVAESDPKPELVPLTDRRDPIPDVGSKFDTLLDDDIPF